MTARWDGELTVLVTRRGRALVGYGFALTGDLRQAEDLVQDALVRVFARFRRPQAETASGTAQLVLTDDDEGEVQGEGRGHGVEAYVRRTMLNLYVDEYRRRKTWARLEPVVATDPVLRGPASGVTARADVAAALFKLKPRQRAVVVLRFYDDLTVPQIAAVLGTAQGTVKRNLHDALAVLRDVFEPEGELR